MSIYDRTDPRRDVGRLVMLQKAVSAECAGMRANSGPTATYQVKQLLGFKGDSFKVLLQLKSYLARL